MKCFKFKAVNDAVALKSRVAGLISETEKSLSQLGAGRKGFDELDAHLTRFYNSAMPLQFLRLTSDDSSIRAAATEASAMIEQFELAVAKNGALYRLVKDCDIPADDKEATRARELYLRDMELIGASHLASEEQSKAMEIKGKIVELQARFSKNIADDTTHIFFTREELDGMDESFLKSLDTDDENRFKITLDYPICGPVMQLCTNAETRKRLVAISGQKAVAKNESLLPEIIKLRQQVANLLGFESDSALNMARNQRMAGDSVAEVEKFLAKILASLKSKCAQERNEVRAYKGENVDFYPWDGSFYGNIRMKEKYAIDSQKVKEYFPLPHVLKGVLECYSKLLGVTFERDEEAESESWHADVQAYRMLNTEDGKFLARFYLDLHPRTGKYSHAACWWMGKRGMDEESFPQVCMVTNFTKKTAERPALLRFGEVQTLFHEFGHVCHACLSQNRYQRLNWTWKAVEMDFLEVPSMGFEKFIFDEKILQTLSSHFETGESLPEELRLSLVKAQSSSVGSGWTGLVNMAEFDFLIHGPNPPPSSEWAHFSAERSRSRLQTTIPAEFEFPSWCSFDHMVTGYNSGYYSYLWSEVVACDLFSAFEASGDFLNPELGMKLRKTVLEPCCRDTGSEMIQNFLGRAPTVDAFIKRVNKAE